MFAVRTLNSYFGKSSPNSFYLPASLCKHFPPLDGGAVVQIQWITFSFQANQVAIIIIDVMLM